MGCLGQAGQTMGPCGGVDKRVGRWHIRLVGVCIEVRKVG